MLKNFKEERRERLGESYFAEGDYENAFYYYRKYLKNLKKDLPDSDDKVIEANIKLGDVEVKLKKPYDAVARYRDAIKELKIKKAEYEKSRNDALEFIIGKYIEVLIKSGNINLGISKDKTLSDSKVNRHVNFAIDEYSVAWPLVKERNGFNTPPLQKLASYLCGAREVLANSYVKSNKINLAQMQYDELLELIRPFVENEVINDKKKKYFDYLLLKHTISTGLLYLRQERYDRVVEVYGNALEAIGINEDHCEDTTIEALNPRIKNMLSNLLHNFGIVCQKTNCYEDAVIHLQKAVKIKKNINAPLGSSVLLLGQFHYKLKDYDKALENFLLAKIELKFDEETEYNESQELCLSNIAYIYEEKNDIKNCISYLEYSFSFLQRCLIRAGEKEMDVREKMSSVQNRIAFTYFRTERYDESIDAYNKCLAVTKKLDDSKLSFILQKIGLIHYTCERYGKAFDYYEEGLEYSNDVKEKMSLSYEQGKVLSKLNRNVEAFEYYEKCLVLGTKKCFMDAFCASTISKCVCKMGTMLIDFEEPATAIHHYEVCLKVLNSNHYNKERLDVLFGLCNANIVVSNSEAAMHYSHEAKTIVVKDENLGYDANKKCFFLIATVYEQKHQIEKSIDILDELIYYARTSIRDNFQREVELAAIKDKMASLKYGDEMYDEALKYCKEALSIKNIAYKVAPSDCNGNEDIAFTLSHMGDVYFKTERYDDALEQYKEALTKVEGAAKAPVLINVGKVLGRGDRQQEALENFLTAFSLVKDLDSKHMHIQQTVLNCIASFYAQVFRFDEAVEYYEKARLARNSKDIDAMARCLGKSKFTLAPDIDAIQFFEVNKKSLKIKRICTNFDEFETVQKDLLHQFAKQKDFDSYVTCLNYSLNLARLFIHDKIELGFEFAHFFHMMAYAYKQMQKYNHAIKSYELSLSMKRMLYRDDENSDTSITYSAISEVYADKGEYQNALNNLREALKGADDNEKVLLLDRIGVVLREMKLFAEAKECYQSSLLLCGSKLPEQRVLILNNLGNIYVCLGNIDDALQCFVEALSLKSTNQSFNEDKKCIFLNIGMLYFDKKLYDKSVDSFKSFLSVRFPSTSSHYNYSNLCIMISVFNHMGSVLVKRSEFEEAIEWFNLSLDILETSCTKGDIKIHETLSYLGNAYFCLHEYKLALSYYQGASLHLQGMEKIDENLLASLLEKTAGIRFKMKEYDLAMKDYQQALLLESKMNNSMNSQRLATLHNIALVNCKKHDYMDAIKILIDLKVKKISFYGNPDHPEVAKIFIDLGNINFKLKEYKRAHSQYKQASKILSKAKYPRNHSYQVEISKALIKIKKYDNKRSFVYKTMHSSGLFKVD